MVSTVSVGCSTFFTYLQIRALQESYNPNQSINLHLEFVITKLVLILRKQLILRTQFILLPS